MKSTARWVVASLLLVSLVLGWLGIHSRPKIDKQYQISQMDDIREASFRYLLTTARPGETRCIALRKYYTRRIGLFSGLFYHDFEIKKSTPNPFLDLGPLLMARLKASDAKIVGINDTYITSAGRKIKDFYTGGPIYFLGPVKWLTPGEVSIEAGRKPSMMAQEGTPLWEYELVKRKGRWIVVQEKGSGWGWNSYR